MSDAEPLPKLPANTLECRFCGRTSKTGTGRSAHERHCEKNPNYKPSQEKVRQLAHLENPDHRCPECAAEGIEKGFTNAGSLGTHRRSQHGIIGAKTQAAKVPCTYVSPEGERCTFKSKTTQGMLIHYGRVHEEQRHAHVPVVMNGNGSDTGLVSPAELRRSMRGQLQNRADLVTIVKIAYPHGIETHDEQQLDNNLSYIFQTASILESRR